MITDLVIASLAANFEKKSIKKNRDDSVYHHIVMVLQISFRSDLGKIRIYYISSDHYILHHYGT